MEKDRNKKGTPKENIPDSLAEEKPENDISKAQNSPEEEIKCSSDKCKGCCGENEAEGISEKDEGEQSTASNDAEEESGCKECAEEKEKNPIMKKLSELEGENRELKDKYLRLYADFDNFRRRSLKEKSDAGLNAQVALIERILPVVDNFERAIASCEEKSAFCEGIEMVAKQLKDALGEMGLCEIDALNEKFDPTVHYAVMTDNIENTEDDIITDIMQKGYKFKEKIIRPSMVKVNKK